MTPEAQQRATHFVITGGLVVALLVAIPSAFAGFGIGWSAAGSRAASTGSPYQVATPARPGVAWPTPAPVVSPEPNYLQEVDALLSIQPRIRNTGGITGQYKFLAIGSDRTVVAQVEIEGQGLDSVVFSWGQTIRAPIAMDADERAALPDQLFTLTDDQLRSLPTIIDQVVDQHSTGTEVERVTMHALVGPPQMELTLVHPREVLEPVVLDLNGRPLPSQ